MGRLYKKDADMIVRIVRASSVAAVRGLVCSVIVALPWQFAAAAEQGFYVGASYGQVKNRADKALFDDLAAFIYDRVLFAPAQGSSAFDAEDAGYGFVGGYRMFANLAFEGGYLDLGEVEYRDTSSGIDLLTDAAATFSQKIGAKTSGMTLSALGILPLSYRTEIYARAGVLFATNELRVHVDYVTGGESGNISDSSTDLLAGVGAGFTFAEIYTARLEYLRVFDAGSSDTGEADIDMISLGVTVTF